jgi:hypothetical protein
MSNKVSKELIDKMLDKLIDYDCDSKIYRKAIEDFKDISWETIVEVMEFDESVQQNWFRAIKTVYLIKTNQL